MKRGRWKSSSWIAVLLMLTMLLSACGGGGGGSKKKPDKFWGVAELIERNDTGPANSPKVAMAANGRALAVWRHYDGSASTIWANRYDGVNWHTEQKLQSDDPQGDDPQIAMNADGIAIAVWRYYNSTSRNTNIWASRFDGTRWDRPVKIIGVTSPATAGDPQITINANGSAIAVWNQSGDGTRKSYRAARFDGTRWSLGEKIEGDTTASTYLNSSKVVMGGDGSAIAVWVRDDNPFNNIWTNHFDGHNWGTATKLEPNDAGHASDVKLAMGANGSTIAVWQQHDGSRNNIWYRRHDGTSWGSPALLEHDNTVHARTPHIAMAGNGHAFAVWSQVNSAHRTNIMARRFDGTRWGSIAKINGEDGTVEGNYPQIAMSGNGQTTAVWQQHDGTNNNVWANRFNGRGWGRAEKIEKRDSAGHAFPKIAMAADGRAVAVWQQSNGDRMSIWANHYE